MKAGQLRELISIEQKSVTRSSIGEEQVSWIPVLSGVHARVRALSGREFFAGQQMQDSVDYQVTIRYRAGLARDMRIAWRGQHLDIVSILPGESRDVLILMCQSGVRNGR
mgnify:FL=1